MSDSWRPKQSRDDRLARTQLSMTPGTVQGRIAQAAPARSGRGQEDGAGEIVEAIFSYSGQPIVGEESPPYFNRVANADLGTVIVNSRSNASGPTTVNVKKNGNVVATITLPGGNNQSNELLVDDVDLAYGDQLTVVCTSVGQSLNGLVVQCLIGD